MTPFTTKRLPVALYSLKLKPDQQEAQLPVQMVTPQATYQHAQLNPDGLAQVDLLTLQRAIGNSQVLPAPWGDESQLVTPID